MSSLRALLISLALAALCIGSALAHQPFRLQGLSGSWLPVDASGASLSFTSPPSGGYFRIQNETHAFFSVTYPSTADTHAAAIGGLPYQVASSATLDQCLVTPTTLSTVPFLKPVANTATAAFSNNSGSLDNAALSGATITGFCMYRAQTPFPTGAP